ncbi:AzlD family protein [Segnochrobactrum spirostomi]|uniref:AzlD family protein n=1 Tax=Segnochrobactrum spirostomi TaxID=2608987 RepID=A0A6A7XZ18_9HYPH|nr:AzlD domain-containing protein [Segnochrobactrum spirostomi]MQT11536.1 hypothetical protein [Segnochrobactrum spirostomi]
MNLDPHTLWAILAMGVATYATRLAGLIVPPGFATRGRLKAAFEAVPAAVLTALIAPTVLATGPAESLAAAITIVAALRLPLLAVIVIGVVAAALLRATIG